MTCHCLNEILSSSNWFVLACEPAHRGAVSHISNLTDWILFDKNFFLRLYGSALCCENQPILCEAWPCAASRGEGT